MKLLLLSALAVAMAQDFEDFASKTRDVTHFVKKHVQLSATWCNGRNDGAAVDPSNWCRLDLAEHFFFLRRKIFWRLLKQKIVSVRTDGFTSVETGGYCGGNHAQSA